MRRWSALACIAVVFAVVVAFVVVVQSVAGMNCTDNNNDDGSDSITNLFFLEMQTTKNADVFCAHAFCSLARWECGEREQVESKGTKTHLVV